MLILSVNLNKIALLRNSRDTSYPSVVEHALSCIEAGVKGITVHPRPDQRHIRVSDVEELATVLAGFSEVEFNIEGNPFAQAMKSDRAEVSDYPGFIDIVKANRPDQCTLVPDTNDQLTSDHGFDLHSDGERLTPIIQDLQQMGVRVSLFMDPIEDQIRLAKQIGADRIELYTEPYAVACKLNKDIESVYQRFHDAALLAREIGLGVNAGHDLNLDNLTRFSMLPGLAEVSIGHALIVDAIKYGLQTTIAKYHHCLGQ